MSALFVTDMLSLDPFTGPISFNRSFSPLYRTEAHAEDLAANRASLDPGAQVAALDDLWRQAENLQLEKWDRDILHEALHRALTRAVVWAGQAKDAERERLLRDLGAGWGVDLSPFALSMELRLWEAQQREGDG